METSEAKETATDCQETEQKVKEEQQTTEKEETSEKKVSDQEKAQIKKLSQPAVFIPVDRLPEIQVRA